MSSEKSTDRRPVIIFDLDGTLVSSMDDLVVTLNVILTEEGHQAIPPESVQTMIGHGAKVLLQRGLEANGVAWTEDSIAPMYGNFLAHYEAHIADHTRPFPGVVACLERLKARGFRLAVCTNKVERLTMPLLAALDLTRHFDAIVGGDSFDKPKPDAAPVLGAIERSGGTKAGSVMVGDSVTDIDAARAAGIPVVAVDFGYTPVPVNELNPDRVISHFDALEAALDAVID
ncbi:phosphoglycolate phosphatase [Roseibium sp. CAU 1637]|uniref:Phosphoglycolate phosphatase n=1 Tax=Roseibium limicola TaxID=2816037 RepID=A0A939EQ88_9HYPH|nr:phosphoglycolate phosphatase [Roseibium limicola]MBO0346097.1 phosphoglycolate phosphatase [Roseibium limicola]